MNAYLALLAATSLAFSVAPVAASDSPLYQVETTKPTHTHSHATFRDGSQRLGPAMDTTDPYDWSVSDVATPAPIAWPAAEPIGHFTVLAMILPVFLMLCAAIFVVNLAYRSARAQLRRVGITHRARTSARLVVQRLLPSVGRVALLHIG